jgi:poly(A) polymerase/tRNA nucleotidyltransferase (CCA-adding enzyme)
MGAKVKIPKEISEIIQALKKAGFDAYPVGGCVRDLLLGKEPKDWDVTTGAKPEEIQKIFSTFAGATADKPATVYENNFGTVGVKTDSKDESLKIVEVTTFRVEGRYSDARHPDEIKFAKTVEEDLSRRDFTINALALSLEKGPIDPFGGEKDLKNKIIRAVGNPDDRFSEDALRMMRAVRLAAQLGFEIEKKTEEAIRHNAQLLKKISRERIRDEFSKTVMSANASWGVRMFQSLELINHIIPELSEGVGVAQNKHHIYTVWEHNVLALEYAAGKNYSLEVRLASLLHDIGKPRTKRGEGSDSTFYQHEYVGAKMTKKILEDLKFSKNTVDYVTHLVRYHLFYYNVGEVTEAGVRRFLARVGPQNVDDLLKVREADRIGSGVPKAFPYKLRHLLFMIDKVKRDPISPKMLKINGNELMKLLSIESGPKVGHILNALLEEVIDDPGRNTKEYLEKIARELDKLSLKELEDLRKKAEKRKDEFEEGIESEMKQKHRV